jgi:hypothetical protein
MDADAFLDAALPGKDAPRLAEWLLAASKLSLGVVLLWKVIPALGEILSYLVGWLGMVGIVLVLHFGIFHLLSCAWRAAGVNAVPLMDWPLASTSLSEFWGRRWNRAFRDLTYRFLFRPLVPRVGARCALVLGFVVSGLIHELVISLPAGGGYGGPTAFFALQGVGLLVERSGVGRWLGLGQGIRGWLFAALLLLLPAGMLFHPPFVLRVVMPFMQAMGSLP